MVRSIAILAGLACLSLVGCKGHGEDPANKPGADTALHGANLGAQEGAPCLTNLDVGLSACSPSITGQRRLVQIRNVVLPAAE